MKHQLFKRVCSAALALTMAASLTMTTARAESSGQIRDRIDELESQQSAIQGQLSDLAAQQSENWASIEEAVAQKNNIDQQIALLYAQIDNINEQIRSYSVLIAENQAQLDEAERKLAELTEKNKERIRAMEEEGEISYWSVIFKANSFTDLIDRLNMIQEIQEADRRRMAELSAATEAVAAAREQLAAEKAALESTRQELEAAQAELAEKRVEADALLAELNERRGDMADLEAEYLAEKNALCDEIANAEQEYTEALRREEEERRRREEEERRRQEEEERRRQEEEAAKNPKPDEDEEEDDTPAETEPEPEPEPDPEPDYNEGWMQPCSYICITSRYGWRASGWHNGVDFAANQGTPIYASRSGTVTTAKALINSSGYYYSYGNYVVINHHDGFSSLYAHMIYFTVSAGEYVNQGDLIGYVGSTGNSTGNHLHFTIFYNGSSVNPMNYL